MKKQVQIQSSCQLNMMVMDAFLSAIITFGISFQTYGSCLDPRLEDFVWFEEPEIYPNKYLDVKSDEDLETTTPKLEGDAEAMKHTFSLETLFGRINDEAFAKHFFANKWK